MLPKTNSSARKNVLSCILGCFILAARCLMSQGFAQCILRTGNGGTTVMIFIFSMSAHQVTHPFVKLRNNTIQIMAWFSHKEKNTYKLYDEVSRQPWADSRKRGKLLRKIRFTLRNLGMPLFGLFVFLYLSNYLFHPLCSRRVKMRKWQNTWV